MYKKKWLYEYATAIVQNKSIAQVITKGVVLLDKQSAFFTKTTACKSNC